MIGRWFIRGLAALAGLGLAACAPRAGVNPAERSSGHPAMWKIADSDTTIYLFGTFHLLPQGSDWRTPAFDRALASSDELVLEIGNLDDQMALAQTLMRLGMSPGLPPLLERVPAGNKAALEAMVEESGIPLAALDRMETWAAGLMLATVTYKRLGIDPNAGVERTIQGPWKASGRPVGGLETIEDQFGLFDRLPEDEQRRFLVAMLDSPEQAKKQFAAMIAAWSRGDVAGIARSFDDETLTSATLREALMTRRNAKWADWLKNRLDRPGTVFVAVGAGHLAGNDSVQRMLAAEGVRAVRVQ
jgi:uncharacterized protein YbaP (TraB family)